MSEENKPDSQEEGDKDVEKAFAARLKSATAKYDERIDELEQRLQQEREERIRLESSNQSPAEPTYTREELLELVEEEKMTQLQADKLWEKQIEANVEKRILGKVTQIDTKKRVSQDLSEYKKLKPGITRNGTEERDKVAEEYNYLVSIGLPDSVETELTAVRNVFGPVEKLKKKIEVETHQETGGGEPPLKEEHKVLKGMNQRQKDYYASRIEIGIYKDWDEVEKELKYSRG